MLRTLSSNRRALTDHEAGTRTTRDLGATDVPQRRPSAAIFGGAGRRNLHLAMMTCVVALSVVGCGEAQAPDLEAVIATQPCAIEWDYALDGTVNYRKTFIYDRHGVLVEEHWDQQADGVYERDRFYRYGPDGVVVVERWDLDGDGEPDGEYVGDLEGMAGGPGAFEDAENRRFAYDSEGRVRLEELDQNGDGIIDARAIYVYDDHDRLLYKEWDGGADGTVEWRGHYLYDCWD